MLLQIITSMITSDINKCLLDVPSFRGTYACNRIPDPSTLPSAFVINTAPITSTSRVTKRNVVEGKHWVVLILHATGKAEYFDSFGVGPTQSNIVEYIARHSKSLKFNNRLLQNPFSRTCGVWCIDYVLQRMKNNVSQRNYLTSFPADPLLSDRQVVNQVTCVLSARQQQLASSIKHCLF